MAQLKGLDYNTSKKSILGWMDKFDIRDWWHKKVDELSKGMQQKIQFISTVMHDPKLIILDEPFTGLDPINTDLIKQEIYHLREKGASIIFSTHRMEQVEEVCEDIVLIDDGKVILEGKVNDIKQDFKENIFEVQYEGNLDENSLNGDVELIDKDENRLLFKLNEGYNSNQFLQSLIKSGLSILSFNEILPTLNEIFIKKVEEND